MKMKLTLAALGAALALSATPAMAQYNSGYGGYHNYGNQRDYGNHRDYGNDRDYNNRDYGNRDYGRNRGGDIVVSYDTGTFRFNSGDREYYRLVRQFGFRPGYAYQYSHTCDHYGCDVVMYQLGGGRPLHRFHAPYFSNAFDNHRVPGSRGPQPDHRDYHHRY